MFGKVVIATFLPDHDGAQRKNYKAPPGGFLTRHHFEWVLQQHREMFEPAYPGIKFREVQTGPNAFSFIHPEVDKRAKRDNHAKQERVA
jgi:hypothetical protein